MQTVVDQALQRWQEADLLTAEQVADIQRFEAARPPVDDREVVPPDASSTPPQEEASSSGGSSLIAEGLAYIGAALAFGAGLVLFGELWDDLGAAARIGLSTLGTALLGAGSFTLRDRAADSLQRLATVLAALAVVGVAGTIGISLSELTELSGEVVAALAGVGGLAVGVPVHLARESWPTTLAMGGALLLAVLSAEAALDLGDGTLVPGVTLMGLGLAWAVAGWSGLARPRTAFEVTGLLAGGVGVQMLAFDEATVVALLVGLFVSGGAMAVGVTEDRTAPAVLGGLGITVYAPQLVMELFGETIGGPLALFVGGISLVTVAITILRRKELV